MVVVADAEVEVAVEVAAVVAELWREEEACSESSLTEDPKMSLFVLLKTNAKTGQLRPRPLGRMLPSKHERHYLVRT